VIEEIENKTFEAQHFHENGVAFPHRILSEKEVIHFRNEFELMENAFNHPIPYVRGIHNKLRWVYDLTLHPKILNYISPILGHEISVLGVLILTKYPQTNIYVPWHQDGVYSDWNADHSLSVWLALSDSTPQNGCMQVIPQTHLDLKQEHIASTDQNNLIHKRSPEIATKIDESKAVNLELKAGEASLHHQNIIHGSKANYSNTKRIGFVIKYMNTKHAKHKEMIYARGTKRYNHIKAIERPIEFHAKNDPVAYKHFLEQNIGIK
jgi:non-heme Fe2+,alpha-ketoglutarate-dependent halogenase